MSNSMIDSIKCAMQYSIFRAYKKVFVEDDLALTSDNLQTMLSLAAEIYNQNMGTKIGAEQIQEWMVWNFSVDIFLRLDKVEKVELVKVKK